VTVLPSAPAAPTVAFVTLGCGRNEVDSDQSAGALAAAGFRLIDDPEAADCVLVNTCAFIEPAREESVETVLAACDLPGKVVVIGCMAERYRDELAGAVAEADAVVGFADYGRLPQIVAGLLSAHSEQLRHLGSATAHDGRVEMLQMGRMPSPPTASFPVRTVPKGPWAYLRIAGGCDRVCTFCAIPSFRGRFASRPADELLAEAQWLVDAGARELVCVSENTTSWGKDLPGGRAAVADLIDGFGRIDGLERVRLLYLQPAEIQPELLDAMAASPVVAPYYDLSLQHASGPVLRRMGRMGDHERFAALIEDIRRRDSQAVFRSSFITGFPGETEQDVQVLADFLDTVRLDWAGFFTFSIEDGTPSATMPDQVPHDEACARRDHLVGIAEAVAAALAEALVGRELAVLIEEQDGTDAVGRSYRESPETDGEVRLPGCQIPVGRMVPVRVTTTDGVDLVAEPIRQRGGA
jgi:ribosomal protein S12 methylthiotransferase